MPETLEKLRPDRDLQCYFERPSAIAALSDATPLGCRISGTWRQQFDWAVLEWNRDNVMEHPGFRNLPDGDLSGLILSYEEERTNAIPMDSDLFATVDWPYLRIWADPGGGEQFYRVRLKDHAEAIAGGYTSAWAEFLLQGTVTADDYVGLSFLDEHHTYQLTATDTLESAIAAIADSVNGLSAYLRATVDGAKIRLTYAGGASTIEESTTGANGNRLGAYGFVAGAKTESWSPAWQRFSGGVSPTRWRVTLNFGNLTATDGRTIPAAAIRKMRWTYSAELQAGAYARSEFEIRLTNWTVTGTNRAYRVAGPGSRRIEDSDGSLQYQGAWVRSIGNFSGGTIRYTTSPGASVSCSYRSAHTHSLYLGTRHAFSGASVSIVVDSQAPRFESLLIPGEDVLVRMLLGVLGPGTHTVTVTHNGAPGTYFYFDFLEAALPTESLPSPPGDAAVTLATDWDTDHSIAVAAERTAWMLHALGFHGRANHYVGALWFYELTRAGHQYASVTVDFTGTPEFSAVTQLVIGRAGEPPENDTVLTHLNLIGDTAETVARAFELEINRGYTAIRAEAAGSTLTIYARQMGTAGNEITVSGSPSSGAFSVQVASPTLGGGVDGDWRTDLAASPRLNRAVRDWSRSYYAALAAYGIDVAAAFSTELQHGDPAPEAQIAQRYPNGQAVLLNTPALQTNFSPTSLAFWQQVYREMGDLLAESGHVPYLQFGEVQWWYFPLAGSGMPFYDAYTKSEFFTAYGREMAVIADGSVDPALHPEEAEFLPDLIGSFTDAIIGFVRSTHPNARFEVLYPTDVNEGAFNAVINYPSGSWTPQTLENLKTESFTYTFQRNLNASRDTILRGASLGFPRSRRSFLVGIGDSTTAWQKEVRMARADGLESIVLFALDQFCLIGYAAPLPRGMRRALHHR